MLPFKTIFLYTEIKFYAEKNALNCDSKVWQYFEIDTIYLMFFLNFILIK